jgi:tetraacyldisaccharide 4'-kinase
MTALRGVVERGLNAIWYRNSVLSWCLLPLSLLVRWAVKRRRDQSPEKGATPDGVMVIVIGGLTVGGTGKTPVLIALGRWLRHCGYRVGVISRGYRSQTSGEARQVVSSDDSACVGDEPLLIKRALDVPVVIGRDRRQALDLLIHDNAVDIVLSDDGLQHYQLPRDLEIVVLDAQRGLGNGRLLPAGPLREPRERLTEVDWILERNSGDANRGFEYQITGARHLASGRLVLWSDCLSQWGEQTLAAITALGQPEQFFHMLTTQGLTVNRLSLPDHDIIRPQHLESVEAEMILITAKDAIKLSGSIDSRLWVVEIEVQLPAALLAGLHDKLPTLMQV